MPMRISTVDAQIMRSGSAKFPVKGSNCLPSCAFYWCCGNSGDGEPCQGFFLINGDAKRLLEKQLGENSLQYIKNSYGFIERAIQNNHPEDAEVILRDMSALRERITPQPTRYGTGFLAMVEASRGFSNKPTHEPDPVEREPNTGFRGMLDALRSKIESHPTLTRAIDESRFPPLCNPMSCPLDFARHCRANRPENYGKMCIYKTLKNR